MPVSARALGILDRFPRHLELARPDKLFAEVVDALAEGLDVQTAQVGRVRRAHRLDHADEERDLLLLAATHGLRDDDVAVLPMRLAAIVAAEAVLAAKPPGDAAAVAARAALVELIGPPVDTFTPWPADGADLRPAQARLVAAVAALRAYANEMDLLRVRIATVIDLHRAGNGTIGALLGASANQLDLDIEAVRHHAEGYWHLAYCRDRIRLIRPEPPGSRPANVEVPADLEVVALEENPYVHREIDPFPVEHAKRFAINRPGFQAEPVALHVIGVGEGTMHPMIVDRDAGFGLAFHGLVPDGKELEFERTGVVTLDGVDVTGLAWAFRGGVFAEEGEHAGADFRFTDDAGATPSGPPAAFATAVPFAAAFDPTAVWPHASGAVPHATLAVGRSRWAFFVRVAHHGSTDPTGTTPVPAIAHFQAGIFDASVWAGPPATTAAKLGFEWDEREPYAVKVWIPGRFERLDDPTDPPAYPAVRERVRAALDRHRAAGIRVDVAYASDLWTLGAGVLRELLSEEPEGIVINGTRLSPAPPPT